MNLRGLPLSRNVIDERQGQPVAEAVGNVLVGGIKTLKQRLDAFMEGKNTLPTSRRIAELLLRGK